MPFLVSCVLFEERACIPGRRHLKLDLCLGYLGKNHSACCHGKILNMFEKSLQVNFNVVKILEVLLGCRLKLLPLFTELR